MRTKAVLALAALAAAIPVAAWNLVARRADAQAATIAAAQAAADDPVEARRRADVAAMESFRPGYSFWRHVFTISDHSIAYGSALDGRLLATFPTKADWTRKATWADPDLDRILDGLHLPRKLSDRRDQVARILKNAVGPVLHNSTRGDALLKNAPKYGPFLQEWGTIYERFGVPADIGLAQVIFESGLNPTKRSEANAIGFCQWLQKNWRRLNYFSPTPIEGRNQTTQAPYCAAYLSVLATKYGSFIPALSEHNAGGTNVGRALITGEHLGAEDVRERYFAGSRLARDLRELPGKHYEDVYRSYGHRSYLYAEMVFGNSFNVRAVIASMPQIPIHAMRTERAISLAEIMKRTGLSRDEVRRFNPAIVERVPARGTLYLPSYISEFGADVAFWRRPADACVRGRSRRLPAPHPRSRTVGRSFLRARAGGLQAAFSRDEYRGRHGDGDGAHIRDGPGVHEPPPHAAGRVSREREGPRTDRARDDGTGRAAQRSGFARGGLRGRSDARRATGSELPVGAVRACLAGARQREGGNRPYSVRSATIGSTFVARRAGR